MEDIFDIQEKVAGEIVEALKVQLTPEEHIQLRLRSTDDADAYEHYLKGRFYWNRRTDAGVRKGIEHFEEAIRRDPAFTLAHVGLADSYNILGFYSYAPPREVFPRARQAAERALAINEKLAAAHASLGYVLHYYDWRWQDAAAAFRKAMELDPAYPIAPQFFANHLVAMGKSAEALSAIELARTLDPLSMIINAAIAWVLYFARRYDESVRQFLRTLDLDESFVVGHLYLARAYAQTGRTDDAVRECERGIVLTGRTPSLLAELAHAHAKAGRRDEAISLMQEIDGMRPHRYISPYYVAEIFVGLGDYDAALEWLEKALLERCREMVLLNVEPRLDPVRADRRFEDLVRQVGLQLP
jgi:tetratricopeptide (TPR) repeat protein